MNTSFIASFIGTATPSTIKELAAITHSHEGKWLNSKVNFIGDRVAGIVKIELPEARKSELQNTFNSEFELTIEFSDSGILDNEPSQIHRVRVDANDRAGIVNDISHVLDEQGISILDMDCHRVFVADGGGISSSLFSADIAIQAPESIDINDLMNDIEALSEDTKVIVEQV